MRVSCLLVDGQSFDRVLLAGLGGQAEAAGGFDAVAKDFGDGDDVLTVAEMLVPAVCCASAPAG